MRLIFTKLGTLLWVPGHFDWDEGVAKRSTIGRMSSLIFGNLYDVYDAVQAALIIPCQVERRQREQLILCVLS